MQNQRTSGLPHTSMLGFLYPCLIVCSLPIILKTPRMVCKHSSVPRLRAPPARSLPSSEPFRAVNGQKVTDQMDPPIVSLPLITPLAPESDFGSKIYPQLLPVSLHEASKQAFISKLRDAFRLMQTYSNIFGRHVNNALKKIPAGVQGEYTY